MSKSKPSSKGSFPRNFKTGEFQSRNLKKVDPKKEQFEPTEAQPVNQHKRMAGMS